ncbi:MAG TPA: nuclear transport factor 2 family protein [Candidatus Acidoferrales bacterium]|nr:nuclear transport factor 2 family protein [Candidatus Acidoferrales bacterium]
MRHCLVFVGVVAFLLVPIRSSPASQGAPAARAGDAAIREALAGGVAAWNRGDLDAFMAGYEDSPRTLYVESSGITAGYRKIRDRYRAKYPSPEKMGALRMTDLQVRMLGRAYALAIGRWSVTRAGGAASSGYFTLTFHKTPAGWRILVDHTS